MNYSSLKNSSTIPNQIVIETLMNDFKRLSRNILQTGLESIYQFLKKRTNSLNKNDIKNENGNEIHNDTNEDLRIVSYLRQMRTWEGSNKSRGSFWYDHMNSHILHSFFMILNGIFQLLFVQNLSTTNAKSELNIIPNSNEDFSLASQASQASQASIGTELTNTSKINIQNGHSNQEKVDEVSKNENLDESKSMTRQKRKRTTTTTTKMKKTKKLTTSQPELQQSEHQEQQQLLENGENKESTGNVFQLMINEAMEFKTICRKAHVGSLAEVLFPSLSLVLCHVIDSFIFDIIFIISNRFPIFWIQLIG